MTIGTRLLTWFCGERVGTDQFGNRYYRERVRRALTRGGGRASREKRWVIYQGEPEASKVPPQWHAWLHHTVDEVPRIEATLPLGKGAPAEHDRHAQCLSSAGLDLARGAAPAIDRRLRAVAAGIGADPPMRA